MLKILIPAITAISLAAFAAKTQPATDAALPTASQPAAQMAWHLSTEGSAAKLAYGVANSDQLAMMIVCEPGQDTASIYGDVAPASARDVSVDPQDGMGGMGEKRISVRDAALRGLSERGTMTVLSEDGSFRVAATKNERRAIGQFLDYCAPQRG